jgi:hypothetical protein
MHETWETESSIGDLAWKLRWKGNDTKTGVMELNKLRSWGGTRRPGAWAGASVCVKEDVGVVVLVSQEKWDRLKAIFRYWLDLLLKGQTELDFKKLRSDRGFMVYVTQAYPSLKPYLKGFHLSLETWRGGRDHEGWRIKDDDQCRANPAEHHMEDNWKDGAVQDGPESGVTTAVPRF